MYRILICAAAAGAFCVNTAAADEALKYRGVYQAASVQSQDVGDVDGHTISVVRLSGLGSFPDGSVGTDYSVGTTDYIKGSGSFFNYGGVTLNDGSVLRYSWKGTATVQGAKTSFTGTVTILGGKGRFEGAKGDGTVTGERLQTLATGAQLYIDVTLNIKK
jgi:hypothetical protein